MKFCPHALLIALLILGLSGCKKKDEEYPNVTIVSPTDGQSFQAATDITVRINASDNAALASVTLDIFDSFMNKNSHSYELTGNSGIFDLTFTLCDKFCPSGLYSFRATVYDAAGNYSTDFIALDIREVPIKRHRAFWVTQNGAGDHFLQSEDSVGNITPPSQLQDTFAAMMVDNRDEELILATKLHTQGTRYDYLDPEDLSQMHYHAGPIGSRFSCMSHNRSYKYFAYNNYPYAQIHDRDGDWQSNVYNVVYPVTAIAATNEGFYVAMSSPAGSVNQVTRFDNQGSMGATNDDFAWRIERLHLLLWRIVAAGNESGNGRLKLMSNSPFIEIDHWDLNSPYIGSAATDSIVHVLCADGVRSLDVDGESLSGLLIAGSWSSIGVDKETGQIWLGRNGGIDIHEAGGQFSRTISCTGVPGAIEFWYNK